jgi:dihydrofolate reductase
MGTIHVHEFISLDGVIDAPTWTFDYKFLPEMGRAMAAVTGRSRGILLGRTTYEMFEPAWSQRTAEDDPGAPFFNDTTKYVVSGRSRRRRGGTRRSSVPTIPAGSEA